MCHSRMAKEWAPLEPMRLKMGTLSAQAELRVLHVKLLCYLLCYLLCTKQAVHFCSGSVHKTTPAGPCSKVAAWRAAERSVALGGSPNPGGRLPWLPSLLRTELGCRISAGLTCRRASGTWTCQGRTTYGVQ